jgi:hypothetical protein
MSTTYVYVSRKWQQRTCMSRKSQESMYMCHGNGKKVRICVTEMATTDVNVSRKLQERTYVTEMAKSDGYAPRKLQQCTCLCHGNAGFIL